MVPLVPHRGKVSCIVAVTRHDFSPHGFLALQESTPGKRVPNVICEHGVPYRGGGRNRQLVPRMCLSDRWILAAAAKTPMVVILLSCRVWCAGLLGVVGHNRSMPPLCSAPLPSAPLRSAPLRSPPVLSYPILSYPILSYPILSYPILLPLARIHTRRGR
jgi:hypothetical protein